MPATAAAFPSVIVTFRSALNAIVSESVALLFAVFGSFTPCGAVTVTVFERVPLAVELSFPLTV